MLAKRKQINISLNERDYSILASIAKMQDRPVAYVVRKIVLESINGPDNTRGPAQPQSKEDWAT